jgi:hypothetical protein
MFGKPKKDPKVVVRTPSTEEFQMAGRSAEIYQLSQILLREAMSELGNEMGMSVVLSGITRELRRHFSADMAEDILRGLASTMKDAAKYDVPDDAKTADKKH